MSKIKKLYEQIRSLKKEIGYETDLPITNSQFTKLDLEFRNMYGFELSSGYKEILLLSNSLNFNGVFLYGVSEKSNLDFIEANSDWNVGETFLKYIYYADSDQYIFVQNRENKNFSFHHRNRMETVLYQTENDQVFFEIILECALGEDIEGKYV